MFVSARTLDDLLRKVFNRLLRKKSRITATRGTMAEITGVLLRLDDPRARLSRTEKKGLPFGCLGELLWYLAGSKNLAFIKYYLPRYAENSDDGRTIFGGYGPRLYRMRGADQIRNVLSLLEDKETSRRAVIQLFNAEDISQYHKDVPCTCVIQLLVRGRRLHMVTFMRSNDAFLGLPTDVFAFTMMQELFARTLGIDVGTYKHAVGSLHLYDRDRESAQVFINEGWQEQIPMPSMPIGDPTRAIRALLRAERSIRLQGRYPTTNTLDPYWQDLIRLLRIHRHARAKRRQGLRAIGQLKKQMHSRVYDPYIDSRRRRAAQQHSVPKAVQTTLF